MYKNMISSIKKLLKKHEWTVTYMKKISVTNSLHLYVYKKVYFLQRKYKV